MIYKYKYNNKLWSIMSKQNHVNFHGYGKILETSNLVEKLFIWLMVSMGSVHGLFDSSDSMSVVLGMLAGNTC